MGLGQEVDTEFDDDWGDECFPAAHAVLKDIVYCRNSTLCYLSYMLICIVIYVFPLYMI